MQTVEQDYEKYVGQVAEPPAWPDTPSTTP